MRKLDTIIVHCTATRPDWWAGKRTSEKVAEIRRWHVEERGWSDIGYHYLIDRDGTIAPGRPIQRSGAHTRGHNKGSVGVSLFGGHGSSATDEFADNFTLQQDAALRNLVSDLMSDHGEMKVAGHNEYSTKACPGFNVMLWHGELR
jgi:N-acetylmuramoyl-L-alanine amidase